MYHVIPLRHPKRDLAMLKYAEQYESNRWFIYTQDDMDANAYENLRLGIRFRIREGKQTYRINEDGYRHMIKAWRICRRATRN